MALRDVNRQGWLAIGFKAGAPRLEGRRRDQERELRGGRGRFGSGRYRCLPEVSGRGAAPSSVPGYRLRGPAEPAWEGRRRQAPHHVSQGRAGQGYPERLQTVSAREQGRGREGLGRRPGLGGAELWWGCLVGTGGKRAARGGKKGTVCLAPREGLRTGGGHRGALREEGDVDGASGGRRQRSPGTWLREVSASNWCPGALVGAGRLGGGLWSACRGRGGAADWPPSLPWSVFGGKPMREQGKVTPSR